MGQTAGQGRDLAVVYGSTAGDCRKFWAAKNFRPAWVVTLVAGWTAGGGWQPVESARRMAQGHPMWRFATICHGLGQNPIFSRVRNMKRIAFLAVWGFF